MELGHGRRVTDPAMARGAADLAMAQGVASTSSGGAQIWEADLRIFFLCTQIIFPGSQLNLAACENQSSQAVKFHL